MMEYYQQIGFDWNNLTDVESAMISQLRKTSDYNANHLELAYAIGKKLNLLPETRRGGEKFQPETFGFPQNLWDRLGKNGRRFCRMIAEIPQKDFDEIINNARVNDSRNKVANSRDVLSWDTGTVLSRNEIFKIGEDYKIKRIQAAENREQAEANREYFGSASADGENQETEAPQQAAEHAYDKLCRIECGLFQDKLKAIDGLPAQANEKPRAIISDPPYLKKHFDSNLWEQFAEWSLEHLATNGVLVVMVGTQWLARAISTLEAAGLQYRWTLAVRYRWGKPVHAAKANPFWKPIVVFRRQGDKIRKGDYIDNDAFTVGADMFDAGKRNKKDMEWQQDVETFERLVDYFTKPGDLVVDPFVGSGTTAVACIKRARRFIGAEMKKGLWKKADRNARTAFREQQMGTITSKQ